MYNYRSENKGVNLLDMDHGRDKRKTQPHPPTVMVVEDNSANMNYISFLLNKLNIEVLASEKAEGVRELIDRKPVDCLLLDINLGAGISGLQLMEELRQEKKFVDTPMVAVTAYYGGGKAKELLTSGFTDYLPKPFNLKELRAILERNGVPIYT